jgi:hypothetical protein
MISRKFGAGMRLAGVTTNMPLLKTRFTPRTICFCSEMAPGGQALVQTWQFLQNSSAPKGSADA